MRHTFRMLLLTVTALVAFPASALAHHATGTATCDKATVNLENFSWYDKKDGIDVIVKIDGVIRATKHFSPSVFNGDDDATVTVNYEKPQDAASHTIKVYVRWRTGDDTFTRTVSNCCPTPPPPPNGPCCVDGEPGPPGPAGPPGPPGGGTNTVVERVVVERVTEKIVEVPARCVTKRVYRFIVKRRHQIEGESFARLITAVRAKEAGFKVTVKAVMRGGKKRWRVTVRPPKGKVVAVGQVYVTNVSVRLKGRKGWTALSEKRRLCMPPNGNLNAPAASGPARG